MHLRASIFAENLAMAFQNITSEVKNGIGYITINRPSQMNALTIDTIREAGEALASHIDNAEVYGILLSGSGDKAFIAGADIKEFSSFSVAEAKEMSASGHAVFRSFETSPKPTLAAINGFALGGGLELAMSCHMRIASENAKFGQPEVNLGLIPGYGGTQRLIRLIGRGRAMQLLMTGDMIKAEAALSYGLVNQVCGLDELIPTAEKILGKITSKSPLTIKQIVDLSEAYFDPQRDGLKEEIQEFANCFGTEDFKEGVDAFISKRKAEFKGA